MNFGRVTRVLTDEIRDEIYCERNEKRKIIISIFYHVDEEWNPSEEAFYTDLFYPCKDEFIKRFSGRKNMQGYEAEEEYLRNIKINTYNDAPIIKNEIKSPVIIYSPGLGIYRDFSIFNIEKLVQEGFIVITVGHIYDSDFTILPDGKVIDQSEDVLNSTLEAKERLINIRKNDILFVLDTLPILNENDEHVKEKLDLERVGVIGHSIGGASVFESAKKDNRIKAAAMFDGSLQYFDMEKQIEEGQGLNTPFLNLRRGSINYEEEIRKAIKLYSDMFEGEEFKKSIIRREETVTKQIEGQKQLFKYLKAYKSFVKLKDSEHMTFTDWPMVFNQEKENGRLPVKKAHEIVNEVTVRFFHEFLCGSKGEYTEFISNNHYKELLVIDENGDEIKYIDKQVQRTCLSK